MVACSRVTAALELAWELRRWCPLGGPGRVLAGVDHDPRRVPAEQLEPAAVRPQRGPHGPVHVIRKGPFGTDHPEPGRHGRIHGVRHTGGEEVLDLVVEAGKDAAG